MSLVRFRSSSNYRWISFECVREGADGIADQSGGMGGMMQDLAFAIPGVDEAMGFAEIMKYIPHLP